MLRSGRPKCRCWHISWGCVSSVTSSILSPKEEQKKTCIRRLFPFTHLCIRVTVINLPFIAPQVVCGQVTGWHRPVEGNDYPFDAWHGRCSDCDIRTGRDFDIISEADVDECEECSICMDAPARVKLPVEGGCSHRFCGGCVSQMMGINRPNKAIEATMDSRMANDAGCPHCRAKTKLPGWVHRGALYVGCPNWLCTSSA